MNYFTQTGATLPPSAIRSSLPWELGCATCPCVTFSALVGHDLHESDARGIVDADMDELPTDTVVTVAGDAMSHGADPAELLDGHGGLGQLRAALARAEFGAAADLRRGRCVDQA